MPDSPVGTKQYRITKAIHWHYATEKTHADIADELGVSERKVQEYIQSPPADEVEAQLARQQRDVRLVAFEELRHQLQTAGQASRTAETPVEIWQDEDGHVQVRDIEDDDGNITSRKPVPVDIEMGPDETTRYYRRAEAREIIQMLVDLVGAAEPDQYELDVSGDMSGQMDVNITHHRVTEEDVTADDGDE